MTLKEAAPEIDLAPGGELEDQGRPSRNHANAIAIAVLIAIPAAIFAAAYLFGGHLLLSGDNLLQNYPLRVLVGTDLRQGSLPLWDPFVWSGTPLLAGLNAGAFYPMTLLFAVVSSHVAWVIGQIFVFSSVGVGTFLLFRSGGTSAFTAFLGAFSFTFAGAVASQTAVHIDMGEGLASLPWALLAVRRIGDDGRWRWAVLLGIAFALSILAGSPEAILDTAALCVAFALFTLWGRRAMWQVYASRIAVGAAMAVGLTAFVWIPALHFISHSQRPSGGEFFASEYSFPPYAGILALVPYLEGGYSLFSQPAYFGQSNLEEVSIYIGILPVIATLTLLGRAWRDRIPKNELICWYGVLVVGLVLAFGAGSPLEHLLYHVPFYGRQRDSGRNIVDVDLAACALFAWWVDGGHRAEREIRGRLGRLETIVSLLPVGVVAVVGLIFVTWPGELWHLLRAVPPAVGATGTGPEILLAGALAIGAATLVLLRARTNVGRWARWVSIFVVVDIGLFTVGGAYASAQQPPASSDPGPVLALVKTNLSPGGRYAVFDPDLFDLEQFPDAGEPDIGILSGLPSASGYGSIANGRYAAQTGAQVRGFMDISPLGDGLYEPLGLQVLVTVPESFLVPITGLPDKATSPKVLNEQPGTDPALPGGNSPPDLPPLMKLSLAPARQSVGSGTNSGWWFGTSLALREAVIHLGRHADGQVVRVGVLSQGGGVSWGSPVDLGSGTSVGVVLGGRSGVGVELQVISGPALELVRMDVETTEGRSYLADGDLADAVRPGEWTQVGFADDFAVFRAEYTPEAAWLEPAGSTSGAASPSSALADSKARVVETTTDETTITATSTSPALLVWSSAWDPGWTAELVNAGGDKVVPVKRVGLVQGVEVPAGTSTVRFSYEPQGFALGLGLSFITFGALVVACVSVFAVRRRRSHTASHDALNV